MIQSSSRRSRPLSRILVSATACKQIFRFRSHRDYARPLEAWADTAAKLLPTSVANSKENNRTLSGVAIVSPGQREYLKILSAPGLAVQTLFYARENNFFFSPNVSHTLPRKTFYSGVAIRCTEYHQDFARSFDTYRILISRIRRGLPTYPHR